MCKRLTCSPLIWLILSPVNCDIGYVEIFIFWLACFLDTIVVVRRSGLLAPCLWCSQSLDIQELDVVPASLHLESGSVVFELLQGRDWIEGAEIK